MRASKCLYEIFYIPLLVSNATRTRNLENSDHDEKHPKKGVEVVGASPEKDKQRGLCLTHTNNEVSASPIHSVFRVAFCSKTRRDFIDFHRPFHHASDTQGPVARQA